MPICIRCSTHFGSQNDYAEHCATCGKHVEFSIPTAHTDSVAQKIERFDESPAVRMRRIRAGKNGSDQS